MTDKLNQKDKALNLIVAYQSGDTTALAKLLTLFDKVAKNQSYCYAGKNKRISYDDFYQEAQMAIIRAAESFNPEKTKLAYSYVYTAMNRACISYAQKNFSSVVAATTRNEKKVFSRYGKACRKLKSEGLPITKENIADKLGMSVDKMVRAAEAIYMKPVYLSHPAPSSFFDGSQNMMDFLHKDDIPNQHNILQEKESFSIIQDAFGEFRKTLGKRERDILDSSFLAEEPVSLSEMGRKYGVSKQRIHQIKNEILRDLRAFILSSEKYEDATESLFEVDTSSTSTSCNIFFL